MREFICSTSVWAVTMTVIAYGVGTYFQSKLKASWCNPLIIGSLVMILFLSLTGIPYETYLEEAKPITYLLLPATVSLAIPLYEQIEHLKKNLAAILCGITAGTLTSLLCIIIIAWVFRVDTPHAISMMPKSVTTAIGVDVANELGGIGALTAAMICFTGISGNLMSQGLCKLLHITDPIAKGVAIGTSSHALGTTKALEMGQLEGAMSSLSIAVAGIITAIACPMFVGLLP